MLALVSYRHLLSSHRKKQEHSTNVSIHISSEPLTVYVSEPVMEETCSWIKWIISQWG